MNNIPRLLIISIFLSSLLASATNAGTPSPGVPVAVQLLSPANGSALFATADQPRALPRFAWQAVPGALLYRLEVSALPSFDPAALLVEVPGTPFSAWTPIESSLPDDVELYWHVRVEAQAGTAGKGAYSPAWSFRKDWRRTGSDPSALNTTTLLLPEDGAMLAYNDPPGGDVRPGFSWTPVMGATHYVFQLAQNPDFRSLAYSETTINTTLQLASKQADGAYYWQVIPMQDGAPLLEGYPSVRRVIFDYHTEYFPELLEPADQTTVESGPTFRWTAVRGAQKYVLQYTTSPGFAPADTTEVETFANSYTPPQSVALRVPYFWRVRVVSGNWDALVWTAPFTFTKIWLQKPVLLTPTDHFSYTRDPYFSWSPVSGAAAYRFEVAGDADFDPPALADTTTNTFYIFRDTENNCAPFASAAPAVYWRVTPLDSAGQHGETSAAGMFECNLSAGAPVQVYPRMVSPPLANPVMDPGEDNTVPLPVFAWKRVLNGTERIQSAAYRIQVAGQENIELNPGSVIYTFDTENMNAIPVLRSLLPDEDGQIDYFWRVRPLTAIGGSEIGQWSQEWRMRWHAHLQPPATDTIQPLRPVAGSEWVETLPLFEWMPLQNATSYQVQISLNSDMSDPIGTYAMEYPAYSYPYRLAAGTYYWRVCGVGAGCQQDIWSAPIRFQVAAQSRWRPSRTLGENNSPIIATDPAGDAGDENFDLTNLSITQGGANWYIGFEVNSGPDMKYAVYIDTDHIDHSGAFFDPEGSAITTIAAHRPEYILYLYKIGGAFRRTNSLIYTWDQSNNVWESPSSFAQTAGANILYNSATGYLEITLPASFTVLSSIEPSLSVSILSFANSGGGPHDSVPSDPGVTSAGGSAYISRFASVTERVNLITPFNKPEGDPWLFSTVPPFFWQPLVEVPAASYYEMRIGLDMDDQVPDDMTVILSDGQNNNATGYTFNDDVNGDEPAYFWQIRPWFGDLPGGWSQVSRFQRKGQPAQGLTVSNEQGTPVFSWSLAEGAYNYHLQIDDSPAFTTPLVDSKSTMLNTYTPDTTTFVDGMPYYARVQLGRTASITNDFSDVVQFTVQRPAVTGLRTIPPTTPIFPAPYNPTFCWDLLPPAQTYHLEISQDPHFQGAFFSYETESGCFTIPEGKPDGAFYWRVYLQDGSGKHGPPSAAQAFWKLYPAPIPLDPLAPGAATPLFRWTGVDGAARYLLEISDKPDFSNIDYAVETVNTEHQPARALPFGDTCWRVKIIDRNNIEGPFSDFVYIKFDKIFLPVIRK